MHYIRKYSAIYLLSPAQFFFSLLHTFLLSLAEHSIVVDECVSIADLVLLDTLYDLRACCFADISCLDVRLDVLFTGKLEHGLALLPVTNVRRSNVVATGHELLSLHGREGLIGQTNVVEPSHNLHCAHVGVEVEFVGHVSSVDDEVEGESVRLLPVLLSGADEVVSTKSESIILLVRRVRNGVDLSTESISPEKGKVTTGEMLAIVYKVCCQIIYLQSTNTDDTDLLARTAAKTHKW